MTTAKPEGRPPLTTPPNPACRCDWILTDSGRLVVPVRVREDPTCPVDHRNTRPRR